MTYKLIIFDMDGTLVQSEDCASQAMLDVIPGLTGTAAEVTAKYRGMRLAEIFSDIEASSPDGVPENCLELYRVREEVLSSAMIFASPGADQMLTQLKISKCIASNAPVTKTTRSLKMCNLSHHFDGGIFSAYQVQAWKPDPKLFEYAAGQYGVDSKDCLVVEDSVVGIEAAQAAGMAHVYYDPHGNGQAPEAVKSIADLDDLLRLV